MELRRRVLLVLSLTTVLSLPAYAAMPASLVPGIVFEPRAIVVTSLVPGEPVAIFGVTLVREGGIARRQRIEVIATADSAGLARLDLSFSVNAFARVAAVGLTSAAWAIASPIGSPLSDQTSVLEEIRPGRNGLLDLLVSTRPNVTLLVVSPGRGAWTAFSGDGHVVDADGWADGRTTIPIDLLKPLDPSFLELRTLRPKDVVVVIDPFTFGYSAQVVNQ